MAYDAELAERIRILLGQKNGYDEKHMFGGLGFLIFGNMCCGVHGDALVARIGTDSYDSALAMDGVSEFDITGRPMRGWVLVDQTVISEPHELMLWIERSHSFVISLPPKSL